MMNMRDAARTGVPPTRSWGPSPSETDVHVRLEYVERLLNEGHSRAEIVATMKSTFGVSVRAADRALSKVRKRMVALGTKDREALRFKTVKRLESVSRRAERDRNYAAVVGAERLKAQALGLLAPQEFEVKNTVTVATSAPADMNPMQVAEELVALVEVVTAFVVNGTIDVTPAFAANVTKLNAAVHGSVAVA